MTKPFSPERWAIEITKLLNAVFGADRFPIDIAAVATEYTAQRFPEDPIVSVQGENLPSSEHAAAVVAGESSITTALLQEAG